MMTLKSYLNYLNVCKLLECVLFVMFYLVYAWLYVIYICYTTKEPRQGARAVSNSMPFTGRGGRSHSPQAKAQGIKLSGARRSFGTHSESSSSSMSEES